MNNVLTISLTNQDDQNYHTREIRERECQGTCGWHLPEIIFLPKIFQDCKSESTWGNFKFQWCWYQGMILLLVLCGCFIAVAVPYLVNRQGSTRSSNIEIYKEFQVRVWSSSAFGRLEQRDLQDQHWVQGGLSARHAPELHLQPSWSVRLWGQRLLLWQHHRSAEKI